MGQDRGLVRRLVLSSARDALLAGVASSRGLWRFLRVPPLVFKRWLRDVRDRCSFIGGFPDTG